METHTPALLLIEADLTRRERFYDLLTRHGYAVLAASSAEQALELLKHERPHLMLTSLTHTPVQTDAWIERIRSFDTTTPIIVIQAQPAMPAAFLPQRHPDAIQAVLHETTSDQELLATIQRCLTAVPPAGRERWPAHILVVDDEPRLRQILAEFLTLRGFRVSQVASGDEALALLAHEAPTTVLLDISMPGMDGLLALKKMKALHPALHVIMITGLEEEGMLDQALALGASDYIMKPFNFEYLETTLLSKLVLGKTP